MKTYLLKIKNYYKGVKEMMIDFYAAKVIQGRRVFKDLIFSKRVKEAIRKEIIEQVGEELGAELTKEK